MSKDNGFCIFDRLVSTLPGWCVMILHICTIVWMPGSKMDCEDLWMGASSTRPHTCQQTPCRSSSVHRSNKYSQVKLTNLYIVTETETRYGPWWSFGGKLVGYCTGPAKATKSSKDAFVSGAPKIYRLVGCPDMTCRWTDCFCVLDMVYMSTVGYLVAAYQIWWMPPDAEHRSQSI